MFAEELQGNANRKKQEKNRIARRKKLKEQQLKKQKEKQRKAENQSSNEVESQVIVGQELGVKVQVEAKPSSSGAVMKALEQREIRALLKINHSAALKIQATYRSYQCVQKVVQQEQTLLERRLSDLTTLIEILKKQQKHVYVPPTSLTISLINQMLFLTHTTPRVIKVQNDTKTANKDNSACDVQLIYFSKVKQLDSDHVKLITKIIQIVLLPGILGDDIQLDPTVVWLESKEGKIKLKKILRLVCFVIQARKKCKGVSHGHMPFVAQEDDLKVIEKILQVLIGIDASKPRNNHVVSYCRDMLLSKNYDYFTLQPGGSNIGQNSIEEEDLDLIHLLRSFLLYPRQIKSKIIPPNAEEARENCIVKHDRERADFIFCIVVKGVLESNCASIKSRFFGEVISVPLLTWKILPSSLSYFVQHDKSFQKGCIPLLHFLETFTEYFSKEIANGLISNSSSSVLPTNDVTLTLCPAPSVLCLFANLVQLGYMCPAVNGNRHQVDFDAAASYFNLLSVLVDLIPTSTFSSRQSSVAWLNDGAQMTPIVLTPVILDQCKLILLDSYVRTLFNCAIDMDALNVNLIMKRKDSRDEKLETDLNAILTETLTSVAAKEAKVDRSKGFLTSKWARKLSKKISKVFSNEKKVKAIDSSTAGEGELMNTSTVSRNLAEGSIKCSAGLKEEKLETEKGGNFNIKLFYALSRLYSIILSRWGGTGGEDIVKRDQIKPSKDSNQVEATSKAEPCILSLLNVLCFSTDYVQTAWSLIQSSQTISDELHSLVDVRRRARPIRSSHMSLVLKNSDVGNAGQATLLMFILSLSHILIVTDDTELHDMDSPLPLHQIRRCILLLKNLLYRACCLDDTNNGSAGESFTTNHFGLSLIASSSKLMRDLHDRSSRRAICAPKLWLFDNLLEEDIRRSKTYEDYCTILDSPVLRVCPFLVSFKRRLKLFDKIVSSNREMIQGRNDGLSPRPGVSVHIMRGRVLEDGLIHLNKTGRQLRQRIIVQYLNQAGAKETGIDAGGLFKEFWTDLSALSFNLNYALFCETEDGHMYPNPSSRAAHGDDSIILFEFLGRILGKALYEGITIKPQFAHFFLSFLRGYNFLHMLHDLYTIDKVLYNNLMFLKTYEGDAEDLCLTFTVANDDFGTTNAIELIRNGANIDVTNANKHHYIGLVAKYHVCDRVKEQSEAFTRGLLDVIDRSWLRIFNEPELQVLISGPSNGEVDVEDMKANSRYTGGYTIFDRQIHRFWKIVSSLTRKQQAELLRFVTSCERPPPLGFGSLNPPFTIQRVAISMDSDKLPSSSTCFNILKLPTYSSEKVMRERLIYAIEAGSGFELS